jgi:perosamine synthetase
VRARIPVAGPSITEREVELVADAARNAWFERAGEYPQRFRQAFADYLGVAYALPLPSCTSALHLALAALGVGPGDEVIVPEATWIASSAPIAYVGAAPVFVDIDPVSWCIDHDSVARAITSRTKAVIAVDLYGALPKMPELRRLLDAAGIPLIEDAAEAAGSRLNGRPAGSFGRVGTFSFHGSKTMTTGEGGMLVTQDEELFGAAQHLADHGRRPGDRMFFNDRVAFKYKMSALQAALGLAQLERLEGLVERKREIFGWYQARLGPLPSITLNDDTPPLRNSFWMVTAILDPALGLTNRDLMAALDDFGIDTRPFFHPLSSIPAYAEHPAAAGARERNPVSYAIAPYGINLPSGLQLTQQDVGYVCDSLLEILERGAASPAAGRKELAGGR